MANQFPIKDAGLVPSPEIDVIYTPSTSKIGFITGIHFANNQSGAYVLELYLFTSTLSNPRLLYKVSLDDGNFLDDDTNYILSAGMSLRARSDTSTISFSVSGYEEAAPQ